MEARDHTRLLQMQMQAQSAAAGAQPPGSFFYQQFRPTPSFPLQQQPPAQPIHPHHHPQQQHHQQQQQQHHHHQEPHEHPQGQQQEQQQQHQQQHPQPQPQQPHHYQHYPHHHHHHHDQPHDASKNAVNPSMIQSQQHPDANTNPSVSSCYYPETPPPHMNPHQLQTAVTSPTCIGTGGNVGASMSSAMVLSQSDPVVKKKRGRPRKYATDSNGTASPLTAVSASGEKKGGRGSSKKAQLCIPGTTGQGFTPYVLTIGAGEDVTAKVMTFTQHGPWAVCILSANGAISNASLWHAGMTSGAVTYEGRFEILSLSGVFLLTEDAATGSRTGGLSISLAGQDGRVIGGRVAGLLVAATPIQVVMGTFFQMSRKSQVRAEGASSLPPTDCTTMQPAPTTIPIVDEASTDASGAMLQDQNAEAPLPPAEAPKEPEDQVSQGMPLQSAEWGGHHFDESHGEQM